MIAIIDYGMGNLRSVQKAFEKVGAQVQVTSDPNVIMNADKIVLPGVGAMAPAMAKLEELGLVGVIRKVIADGKPFFGICLGLQLLFEKGLEGGEVAALGVLKGSVTRLDSLKTPHMGWNQIEILRPQAGKMYENVENDADVYFCHSYRVNPKNEDADVAATITYYGPAFISSIAKKNIWAVQFHPEKSQTVGLQILRNFAQL